MTENILVRIFEHNNWANLQILQACSTLGDEQLDAEPHSATAGTIRFTLEHLVGSQESYLSYLTGKDYRSNWQTHPTFDELKKTANFTGQALLALARDESKLPTTQIRTRDGYLVEPWVLMVQVIQHGNEHREQLSSMLSALGITPPIIDGWYYGEATGANIPPEGREQTSG
jgi:uncharacterized damage-inducible protein DinB